MDDKTAALRDLFRDVTETDTVTDAQTADRGSLVDDSDAVTDRLAKTVETMRTETAFETDLETGAYVALLRAFYDGASDRDIAEALGCEPALVARARHDLHLVRQADTADLDVAAIRSRHEDGDSVAAIAAALATDEATVARALGAFRAELASRRVSHRFRDAFADALTDADLGGRLTASAKETGLEAALADAEVDVDL